MGSGDGFVNMKISMSQRTIECSLKIQRASWYDRWETEGVHADRAGLSVGSRRGEESERLLKHVTLAQGRHEKRPDFQKHHQNEINGG